MLTVVLIVALACVAAIAIAGWLLARTRSVIPPKPKPQPRHRRRDPHDPIRQDHEPPPRQDDNRPRRQPMGSVVSVIALAAIGPVAALAPSAYLSLSQEGAARRCRVGWVAVGIMVCAAELPLPAT